MKSSAPKVTVIAPARLHMGFIDLSASLGRNFGSIGVALNEINTCLSVSAADELCSVGLESRRALVCVQQLCGLLNVSDKLQVEIKSLIPEHVGLGSGTQMSLAVGMALSAYYDLGLQVRDIAELTSRGARSGIGIATFEQGGLVVDGGRGANTKTPPVISQMKVPDEWRFLLVLDDTDQGLHGDDEIKAFKELPPFSSQEAARLCYLLMMQALPALAEKQLNLFGDVITQLQSAVGEHFSGAQGGGVFTSKDVAEVMSFLQEQGAVAIGQTSWGPTGFCLVSNKVLADELEHKAKQQFAGMPNVKIMQASVRNTGGEVLA
ncbi:MAG: GHMP kinase [Methyloprofundus sp.]|nr:GHMP kinase [Methyloprofundus sp.]